MNSDETDTPKTTRRDSCGGTGASDAKVFVVYCEKGNGRQYVFQRYATKDQAEAVAKILRDVGCRAVVGVPE